MPICTAYKECRARNLCKGNHCVGEALKKDGYLIVQGEIVSIERKEN